MSMITLFEICRWAISFEGSHCGSFRITDSDDRGSSLCNFKSGSLLRGLGLKKLVLPILGEAALKNAWGIAHHTSRVGLGGKGRRRLV